MSDASDHEPAEKPEIVAPDGAIVDPAEADDGPHEFIEQPAKVMRVGSMLRQLLEELHQADFDENSRDRLRDIYDMSVVELGSALSPDLRNELGRLALPFSDADVPSEAELRVAKAQLVGWLEGLIQGIQATLFAQQMAAQQQLANMRGQLPPGQPPGPHGPPGPRPADNPESRPGTYL
jgi:hypothetical protein